MTLEQMQDEAKKRTEAVIGAWGKVESGKTAELLKEYRKALKEIKEEIKNAYAKFLTGVDTADYYNEIIKYQRLKKLESQIYQIYGDSAKGVRKILFEISKIALSNTYYQNMYAINWFSGDDINTFFVALNPNVVEVSVYGTPEIWAQIKNKKDYEGYLPKYGTLIDRLINNEKKDLQRINQAITAALRSGQSYTDLAKDIGKIFDTTASNALRIARTEGNRNMNAGAYASSQAASSAGVPITRVYRSSLDSRVRQQSSSMDGQEIPINGLFTYPNGVQAAIVGNSGVPKYDINDRCYARDVVNGQNPNLRRAKNPVTGEYEIATFSTFDDYMSKYGLIYDKSGQIREA